MSEIKLINTSELNNNLTSIANTIRSKNNINEQLHFPNGFIDAIENIRNGENDKYIYLVQYVPETKTDEIFVDITKLPKISTLANMFLTMPSYGTGYSFKKITIVPPAKRINSDSLIYSTTAGRCIVTDFNINGTLLMSSGTGNPTRGSFAGGSQLVHITGLIDLGGITGGTRFSQTNYMNMFQSCSKLKTVSFVPGSMKLSTTNWYLSWCAALSNESLVSIANALLDTYSGTLTFHATPRAKLANIIGTVTSDETLSTFTIDENGTMSLEDFLTTIKGATLA